MVSLLCIAILGIRLGKFLRYKPRLYGCATIKEKSSYGATTSWSRFCRKLVSDRPNKSIIGIFCRIGAFQNICLNNDVPGGIWIYNKKALLSCGARGAQDNGEWMGNVYFYQINENSAESSLALITDLYFCSFVEFGSEKCESGKQK